MRAFKNSPQGWDFASFVLYRSYAARSRSVLPWPALIEQLGCEDARPAAASSRRSASSTPPSPPASSTAAPASRSNPGSRKPSDRLPPPRSPLPQPRSPGSRAGSHRHLFPAAAHPPTRSRPAAGR
jgi:hypothetical protein